MQTIKHMIVYKTAYNKAYNTGVNLLFNEINGVMDEPRACFQSRFKSWIYIFVPCTIFSMWNHRLALSPSVPFMSRQGFS